MGTPQNFGPPGSTQFRPGVPPQQGQPFLTASSQQFPPGGQGMVPNQPVQYSQPMQQLPPRLGLPGAPLSSQAMPMPYVQPNRPITSGPLQNYAGAPFVNHASGVGGMGVPFSSSYTFQPASHMPSPAVAVSGQHWSGSQGSAPFAPAQQAADPYSISAVNVPVANPPDASQNLSSDWQEHATSDGRRYYYNKKTKQSSWEKPLELMTPIEMSWQVWRLL